MGCWRYAVLSAGAMFMTVLAGCATTQQGVIGYGDTVTYDYTCRTDDGDIIVTSDKETAFSENARVSNAFVPLKAYIPVVVTVGAEIQPPPDQMPHPLIEEVSLRISKQLEGLGYSKTMNLQVAAEAIEGLPESERQLKFSKIMKRPKQRRVPKAQFIQSAGKEPELGEILFADAAVQWKIVAIDDDSVEIQYLAQDGMNVTLPLGDAVMRERVDHYDLVIDVRKDNLVRVGPYVGRISDVGEKLFTVDFSHPFGGRTLNCEVTPMQANKKESKGKNS